MKLYCFKFNNNVFHLFIQKLNDEESIELISESRRNTAATSMVSHHTETQIQSNANNKNIIESKIIKIILIRQYSDGS